MMPRGWIVAAALWTLGAASLAAANFWDAKPYTDWSQKEVEAMLTDSPWARKLSVVIPIPPREAGDGAGGRGGGRGGDDGGGRGFPVPAPQLRMLMTWRSARPVREALVRSANGAAAVAGAQPLLDRQQFYMVTLSGVPARFSRATATAATTSFLRPGRKAPIALAQGGIQQDGATITLVFAFPRTDLITLDDKEVEFVTTLGTVEIKKKFTLKDMVVNGELEL